MKRKGYWVAGIPCTAPARGKCAGEWRAALRRVMRDMPALYGPCELYALFLLPDSKLRVNAPGGPDGDNLGRVVLNVLAETVLRGAPGRDSCVVSMTFEKRPAEPPQGPGVYFELATVGR